MLKPRFNKTRVSTVTDSVEPDAATVQPELHVTNGAIHSETGATAAAVNGPADTPNANVIDPVQEPANCADVLSVCVPETASPPIPPDSLYARKAKFDKQHRVNAITPVYGKSGNATGLTDVDGNADQTQAEPVKVRNTEGEPTEHPSSGETELADQLGSPYPSFMTVPDAEGHVKICAGKPVPKISRKPSKTLITSKDVFTPKPKLSKVEIPAPSDAERNLALAELYGVVLAHRYELDWEHVDHLFRVLGYKSI